MNAYRESETVPEKTQRRILTRPWMPRLGAVLAIPAAVAASIAAGVFVHPLIAVMHLTLTAIFGPVCFVALEGPVRPSRIIVWAWWPVVIPFFLFALAVRWIRTGDWR